jgi:DNA-directed RNA polymerase specialized sigma24 family protein
MARLYGEKRANLLRVFAARLRSASEAEDLIQDLFLKVQALGEVEVEGDGSALLFRMANNLMLDRLRSQSRASARDGGWHSLQGAVLGDQQVADTPSAEEVVAGAPAPEADDGRGRNPAAAGRSGLQASQAGRPQSRRDRDRHGGQPEFG